MITKQDIVDADPVLIVYPAGTGGEHIAHTLSMCSPEFETLQSKLVKELNQHHTICVLHYSTAISDIEDFNTAIDDRYNGNFKSKRIVLKDHPSDLTLEFYSKHFPNINVIFVTPIYENEYFAELTFKKLAVKVQCPIDKEYLHREISKNLTLDECQHLLNQANQFEWVWRHELHILMHQMRKLKSFLSIEHYDTLDKIKNDHKETLINTCITTISEYQQNFKNFYIVNCDSLVHDSADFWKQIKDIIPTLDLNRAIRITNNWIEKNNKLGKLNEQ